MNQPISRRTFLHGSAGAVAALPFLLEACGGAASSSQPAAANPSAATSGGVKMPTYVPFQGVKPDLPSDASGLVPPGFLNYPQNLVKTVSAAPGKGGDVTIMTFTFAAPPPGPDQNPAWAAINKDVNANVKVPIIAQADYTTKLQTTIASGALPDIMLISYVGSVIENQPQFLDAQAADLTPFLSGDGIKAYPNLANIPTYSWKSAVSKGKIMLVPVHQGGGGFSCLPNYELLEPFGKTTFKSADDFLQAGKDFTQTGKRWFIGGSAIAWFPNVFRVPNQWRVGSDGKLTKDYETDEYKAMVTYLRQMWDAGIWYPDTPTMNLVQGSAAWDGGKYAIWFGGFGNYQNAWHNALQQDPNFKAHLMVPFPADGQGKAVQEFGNGTYALLALKKAPDDRIKELLGILNYLAAPFGSQEANLIKYGVKDVDYTLDAKGNPQPTKQGQTDTSVPWRNIEWSPDYLYDATNPEFTQNTSKELSQIFALGQFSPTLGLYSASDFSKGAQLRQKVTDGVNSIMFGREPVSSYDALVKDWRTNGGDQIRTEYEKALQAAK